ncbi:sulfatase-like hydrolase/transferase [Pseudomonas extremaustralis]|uniref:sulfatase-like hydrolase/transferase n=1 Tax=Pseudomonas extremaustralis TaxID=359110 RepID=UPI002855A174|nr:sulfatase-like hydrolase/transferase [Pseudomonas extremaustralis]MDR6578440.1 hypothetical protein [Pseudomonas extremaustralis]
MPAILKRIFLPIWVASTLFLWVPLYAVYLSINDINFSIHDFFTISVASTALASVLLLLILTLANFLRLKWLANGILYFILFWISISGFIFPLAAPAGMQSPEELPINILNLVITAIASVTLTLLTYTKIKQATQAFVLVLTITSLGSAAGTLYKIGSPSTRFSSLSSSDNVIVLSFDGLAGGVAMQVLEKDPELKYRLRDFTFYNNAISLAPATEASIRSEVYGNINFRELSEASADLPQKLSEKTNSIKREQNENADVITYGNYSTFNPDLSDVIVPGTFTPSSTEEKIASTLNFYSHIAARTGTPLFAAAVSTQVHAFQKAYLHDYKTDRAVMHKGAAWDALNTLQSEELSDLTKKLHISDAQRSIRYMHFVHTHFPVDLDENCTYRSDDQEWFDNNQNYQGLTNETHCALRQAANFVDKLKDLGVYNNSLFVIKSDHGAKVSYFSNDPNNNIADGYEINENTEWGYNRYRPLLMIKPYLASNDALTYSNKLVSLGDLAKTLCLHSPKNTKCEQYKGLDLLNSPSPDTAPTLYIDVAKDASSSFDFDSQMTIQVSREDDFVHALKSTKKVSLVNPTVRTYEQRRLDLTNIQSALAKYHDANGSYPVSEMYDGLHSDWGRSTEDWIPKLAPRFIKTLPRDPGLSNASAPQYLYRSDGVNYKVIAHGVPQSCADAIRFNPELVDPARRCSAFGYWTEGARDW